MYPDAEKIVLVMDNLNTHKPASLYKDIPRQKHGGSSGVWRSIILRNMAAGLI